MAGKAAFDLTLDALSPTAVVTDCVYTPLRTDFLTAAAARGCVTVDGLGMLLHQAVPGFERWFGRRPEVTPELRAVVLAA
jgi:shikimate dehydrogenase